MNELRLGIVLKPWTVPRRFARCCRKSAFVLIADEGQPVNLKVSLGQRDSPKQAVNAQVVCWNAIISQVLLGLWTSPPLGVTS